FSFDGRTNMNGDECYFIFAECHLEGVLEQMDIRFYCVDDVRISVVNFAQEWIVVSKTIFHPVDGRSQMHKQTLYKFFILIDGDTDLLCNISKEINDCTL